MEGESLVCRFVRQPQKHQEGSKILPFALVSHGHSLGARLDVGRS